MHPHQTNKDKVVKESYGLKDLVLQSRTEVDFTLFANSRFNKQARPLTTQAPTVF